MQRVSEFDFYTLAQRLTPLREINQDVEYTAVFLSWVDARDAIREILEKRPLVVTRFAANKLIERITEHVPEDFDQAIAKGYPEGEHRSLNISAWRLGRLSQAVKDFETVLAAECQVLDTYLVMKAGAYSTADLVERAHNLFGELAPRLSEVCKKDFDQAGRSLILLLPTACAFHCLRGTESVLRQYYEVVTGSAPKKAVRNWGAYVAQLRKSAANESVVAFIEHVRTAYRNPILHPEEFVDQAQALVLLGACVSLISLLMREIDSLKAQSLLLPLTPPDAG